MCLELDFGLKGSFPWGSQAFRQLEDLRHDPRGGVGRGIISEHSASATLFLFPCPLFELSLGHLSPFYSTLSDGLAPPEEIARQARLLQASHIGSANGTMAIRISNLRCFREKIDGVTHRS